MTNVKKVPAGFHTVTPFLNIKGAADAIELYRKALGAEVVHNFTMPTGQVMHAELRIGGSPVLMSDAMQQPATQSSLFLYVDDCDAWWKRATAAGFEVVIPLADQFWGDRWGLLTDRFGNRWGIATHIEDVPGDEMARRAQDAMKQAK